MNRSLEYCSGPAAYAAACGSKESALRPRFPRAYALGYFSFALLTGCRKMTNTCHSEPRESRCAGLRRGICFAFNHKTKCRSLASLGMTTHGTFFSTLLGFDSRCLR